MKKEKIAISIVALLIGLVVAVGGFYFYQSTKTLSRSDLKPLTRPAVSPTPEPTILLSLDRPKNEEVFKDRVITVSGKTAPDSKLLIYTSTSEESAIPTRDGSFSTTITINQGQNILYVTAISPDGIQETIKRVVTHTTEEF